MREILAALLTRHGKPAEAVSLERRPLAEPGPGEVLIEMRAALINPADLNIIEGSYGRLPALPAVCGHDGAGVVAAVGPGVSGIEPGQRARPAPGIGTWREALTLPAAQVWPLPPGLDDEQAAALSVNPASAWRMLHDFVPLAPGDWVLQNAASSAVGRYLIQLARELGLRTANLVRRPGLEEELGGLGADLVLASTVGLGRALREATGGAPIRLALNAVGGASALALARQLAPGGTLVTYGAMSRRPLTLGNGLLIFRDLRLRGFWMTAWYEQADRAAIDAMLARLGELFVRGTLRETIEARYPLAELWAALAHAARTGRRGKVLLRLSPSAVAGRHAQGAAT